MKDCLQQQKRTLMTEYLYAQALNISAGNTVAACLLTAIYWTLLSPAILMTWLVAVLALQGWRLYLARAFQLRNRYANTDRWYKNYANVALINGCLWGGIGTVISQQCSAERLAYLMMISGALVACCSMSAGALFTTYKRFAMPALLMPGFYLLTQIGTDKFMIGVLVMCWSALMYSTARRFNKFAIKSLGFECENIALLQDLETEKVHSLALRENITIQEQIIEKLRGTLVKVDAKVERSGRVEETEEQQTNALRLVNKK